MKKESFSAHLKSNSSETINISKCTKAEASFCTKKKQVFQYCGICQTLALAATIENGDSFFINWKIQWYKLNSQDIYTFNKDKGQCG